MTISNDPVKYVSSSPEETMAIGRKIAAMSAKRIGLIGDLGAGKTVFSKGYFSFFGIPEDQINSPSFVIVNTYTLKKEEYFHIDLYRYPVFNDDFGFWEILHSGRPVLIEWADRLKDDIKELELIVSLEGAGDKRSISLLKYSDS
ncbi:tRNA (adenosine(37)-N6)-threonylcarbamoyltransferase complex ATPase subunit type 1 TsaE [bacterium]|nr:tRNA (adenosine(37)-N6)-threonylcarbamoyltransferase complex ATPase subunit type 1 TsaE [bacterium]